MVEIQRKPAGRLLLLLLVVVGIWFSGADRVRAQSSGFADSQAETVARLEEAVDGSAAGPSATVPPAPVNAGGDEELPVDGDVISGDPEVPVATGGDLPGLPNESASAQPDFLSESDPDGSVAADSDNEGEPEPGSEAGSGAEHKGEPEPGSGAESGAEHEGEPESLTCTPVITTPQPNLPGIPVRFSSVVEGAEGAVQTVFYLYRSNGQLVATLSRSGFSWTFRTPAEYRVDVEVTDAAGRSAQGSLFFTVEAARPHIDELILDAPTVGQYAAVTVSALTRSQSALRYRYCVTKPNGVVQTVNTSSSFVWTPVVAGLHGVTLTVTDLAGRSHSLDLTVEVRPNPIRINDLVTSPYTLMTKWPIAGEVSISGGPNTIYARLDLVRSNGSVLKLSSGLRFKHIFVTPDQYKIRATVRDGFGAGAVKLFDLPIVRNQLTIEKIIAASTDGAAGAAEMLRVYQPILFETNVVGGQGQVTCGIELQRANGTTIRKLNQSRLAWQFFTPGDYVIRVVAHSADGQEDIRAQTFTIAENPLVIDSFTVDETHVPKILTETALTVRHSGGYGRKSYAFFLVSPDGSLSELGTAARPNFSWTFLTPGEYTLNVRVEDELNHCAEGSCDLSVEDNLPEILPVIDSGGSPHLIVGTPCRFTAVISGDLPPEMTEVAYYLRRSNGVLIRMNNRARQVRWTFQTPDVYAYRVELTDAIGRVHVSEVELEVLQRSQVPLIEDFSANRTTLVLDRLNVTHLTARVSGGEGELDYRFYLSRNGDVEQLIRSGPEAALSHSFDRRGEYTVRLCVTDAAGHLASESIALTVIPDYPRIEWLSVNTATWPTTRRVRVRFKCMGGSGKVHYVIKTFNQGKKMRRLQTTRLTNVALTIKDPGVTQIEVVAIDSNGTRGRRSVTGVFGQTWKTYYVDTTLNFAKCIDFKPGDVVRTAGYERPGDRGAAKWKILSPQMAAAYSGPTLPSVLIWKLGNGDFAYFQPESTLIHVAAAGMDSNRLDPNLRREGLNGLLASFSRLKFSPREYVIELSLTNVGLIINSGQRIYGNGAVLKLTPHDTHTYDVVSLDRVRNVYIENLRVDGNKGQNEVLDRGQWGNGFAIRNSVGVELNRCHVKDTWGDGFYIGARLDGADLPHNEVVLRNCSVDGSRRQGVSIVAGKKVEIFNFKASNIRGDWPMGAIDIEPNWWFDGNKGAPIGSVFVDGLIADNCYAGVYLSFYGLLEGQPMTYVRIRNVQISNCTHSLIVFPVGDNRPVTVELTNWTMRNNVHGHYISNASRKSLRLVMNYHEFYDSGYLYPVWYTCRPVVIESSSNDKVGIVPVGNITLNRFVFHYSKGKTPPEHDVSFYVANVPGTVVFRDVRISGYTTVAGVRRPIAISRRRFYG